MPDFIWWAAALCGVVGILLIFAVLAALKQRRPLRLSLRVLAALMFMALAATLAAAALGVEGYRALTHEELAATVTTVPVGPQKFRATFKFPDGHEASYTLAGDELYVDARVLKWHPWANVLGLHTAYEFDRVAGRYTDLA